MNHKDTTSIDAIDHDAGCQFGLYPTSICQCSAGHDERVARIAAEKDAAHQAEDGILRVGDFVMWRGGFGRDEAQPAKVTSITITEEPREKYGKDAAAVAWSIVEENRVTVGIDDTSWAYGEQITPM